MTSIVVFSIILFVVICLTSSSFLLLVLADDSLGCPSSSTTSSPATFNIQIYQTNENTQSSSSSSSSSSSVNDQINSLMNPFFQSLGYDLQTIGGGGATPNFIEVLATTETPLRSNITCSGSTNNNNNNNNQKCFDFTFSVNSDSNMINVISSKINVANNINLNYYTRNSLEYSFASLYRNSSSTPEVIATLDLLGWNSVSVLSSSCATQKSSSAATALMKLDKLDFTGSSSQNGKDSEGCNRFSVCARSSSSSQNNNCDSSSSSQTWNEEQLSQLKLAFSQLLGGITIVTNTTSIQNNNNTNNNQQVFSIQSSDENNNTMTALELISQVGLEDISAGLDALVFRGGSNNNNQVKTIFPTWQRLGVNVSSAPSCFEAAKNDPDLFTSSAARSPIDFLIPFKCDQNDSSPGAVLQQHDALTLAQNITSSVNNMMMTNFSLPLFGTPLTIVNFTFTDGDLLSSSSSSSRRRCGVKIVISSSSSSQKQQQFQKYYSCLTLWGDQSGSAAQIMVGGPASSSPKKQTPPLMLISMIVTAILWVLLCAYCYKFLPRHRRTNLPHQQNSQQALEEAMLSNEEIQQQRMNNANNNINHKIGENDIENDDHAHEDMNTRTKKSADDLRRYSPMGGDEKEAEPNKIFAM